MTTDQYLKSLYQAPWNHAELQLTRESNYDARRSGQIHLTHLFGGGSGSHIMSVIIWALLLAVIVISLHRILVYFQLRQQKMVYLELIPPAFQDYARESTEKLLMVVHGLGMHRPLLERLRDPPLSVSLEIVSTKDKGVRYIARTPKEYVDVFRQAVQGHLPDIIVRRAKEYLPEAIPSSAGLIDLRLRRHFAYPLNIHPVRGKEDPAAYIAGAMTKLKTNELITLQLVLIPSRPRSAIRLRDKIMSGKAGSLSTPRAQGTLLRLSMTLLSFFVTILQTILELVGEVATGGRPKNTPQSNKTPPGPAAQALLAGIDAKLAQPLFRTSLRGLVLAEEQNGRNARIRGLLAAFAPYQVTGYQGFKSKRHFLRALTFPYRMWQLRHRLPALWPKNGNLLSATELAALFHFPDSLSAQRSEGTSVLTKTLPAPLSLRQRTRFDIVLGENIYQGQVTPIGLNRDERQRHVYIIGGTGNGKTTMLEYAAVQDIRSGKGVAFVDPQGDTARKLLRYIPPSRVNDVIYLNPSDLKRPIGLNLLELRKGLKGSELAHEKELVTEAVISVFRKIFEDNVDTSAFRIERILRNAIYTALLTPDPTIFTVLRLLTDSSYRRQVVRGLSDERLKRFWLEELGRAGEYQRVKMSSGPITRIERFERSESARRMLDQTKSTIDFDEIVNSGKILICNFSKGRLGEDTSSLFGTIVLAKLQLAAWRRDNIEAVKRKPFYLYVDEFQEFASSHFMELFSQARKYGLFMTIAQQSVFQLKDRAMVNTILDNVGSLFAFRSKSADTEQLLLPQFAPYVKPGEIANLPSYNFYAKITAVTPELPTSGRTILLKRPGVQGTAEKVIHASRRRYGRRYTERKELAKKPEHWVRVPSARV